jgi:GTPase SAR1 family protein
MPLVLIGNKVDLADRSRAVSTEEAKLFAAEKNMLFFETSAYDATNVKHAFETMFDHVYKELAKNKLLKKNSTAKDGNGLAVGTTRTVRLQPPSSMYQYNHRDKENDKEGGGCC